MDYGTLHADNDHGGVGAFGSGMLQAVQVALAPMPSPCKASATVECTICASPTGLPDPLQRSIGRA